MVHWPQHNDANDKDDGLNPVVAHGHGDDEEDKAEGEGYASYEVDKLADLKRGVEGQFSKEFQRSFHLLVDRSLGRF